MNEAYVLEYIQVITICAQDWIRKVKIILPRATRREHLHHGGAAPSLLQVMGKFGIPGQKEANVLHLRSPPPSPEECHVMPLWGKGGEVRCRESRVQPMLNWCDVIRS